MPRVGSAQSLAKACVVLVLIGSASAEYGKSCTKALECTERSASICSVFWQDISSAGNVNNGIQDPSPGSFNGYCVECESDCDCGVNQYCGIDKDKPLMIPAGIKSINDPAKSGITADDKLTMELLGKSFAGMPIRSKCYNYEFDGNAICNREANLLKAAYATTVMQSDRFSSAQEKVLRTPVSWPEQESARFCGKISSWGPAFHEQDVAGANGRDISWTGKTDAEFKSTGNYYQSAARCPKAVAYKDPSNTCNSCGGVDGCNIDGSRPQTEVNPLCPKPIFDPTYQADTDGDGQPGARRSDKKTGTKTRAGKSVVTAREKRRRMQFDKSRRIRVRRQGADDDEECVWRGETGQTLYCNSEVPTSVMRSCMPTDYCLIMNGTYWYCCGGPFEDSGSSNSWSSVTTSGGAGTPGETREIDGRWYEWVSSGGSGGGYWWAFSEESDGMLKNINGTWYSWDASGVDGFGQWDALSTTSGNFQYMNGGYYYWDASSNSWREYEGGDFQWKEEYSSFNGVWKQDGDLDFYSRWKLGDVQVPERYELVEPCGSPEYDASARSEPSRLGFRFKSPAVEWAGFCSPQGRCQICKETSDIKDDRCQDKGIRQRCINGRWVSVSSLNPTTFENQVNSQSNLATAIATFLSLLLLFIISLLLCILFCRRKPQPPPPPPVPVSREVYIPPPTPVKTVTRMLPPQPIVMPEVIIAEPAPPIIYEHVPVEALEAFEPIYPAQEVMVPMMPSTGMRRAPQTFMMPEMPMMPDRGGYGMDPSANSLRMPDRNGYGIDPSSNGVRMPDRNGYGIDPSSNGVRMPDRNGYGMDPSANTVRMSNM